MENCKDIIDLPPELIPEIKDMPGELKEIAGVIGVDNTLKLAQAFRGCTIYMCSIDHLIRKKRNASIRDDHNKGMRVNPLVRKYKLSKRQIETILNSPA